MKRGRWPAPLAAVTALAALASLGWGTLPLREAPAAAHPTLLDGEAWVQLTLREKELLVQGFLIGAATEQALVARAGAPGAPAATGEEGTGDDGASALDRLAELEGRGLAADLARLRAARALDFAYAPGMLARRVDEFYWWRNNRDVPLAGALAEVAHRLRHEHF